ncbi:MAG: L-serine ammonia-lyase, iron-sulfur-dependent, subunit alpha [Spirochaetales bacterium]|nr:L-serine ammonia-lyase, iron-sulfur-dependent, subunit alpha [Spirochaetales bacterium]
MRTAFTSSAELLELVAADGRPLPEWMVAREAFMTGRDEAAIRDEIARRLTITRTALARGFKEPQRSLSGLTDGAAARLHALAEPPVRDELWNRALAYAVAINEVSACGGRIVAFPTAGSSGIVPGLLWAWRDEREGDLSATSPRLQDAVAVAGAVGAVIAARATLSGAAGGCQAECGAAAAMGAGALAWLSSGDPSRVFNAAALSLKNSLGLACDPVAGLVEVPCVKRNAFLAGNALVALTLDSAGILSAVPFDEVVSAMKAIGDMMSPQLKESAEGGLAMTPTGLRVKAAMEAGFPDAPRS